MMRVCNCAVAGLWALCQSTLAIAGSSINQFETKDLESEAGDLQFQSQNAIALGQPKRQIHQPTPGTFTFDDNTVTRERYALEMQMGITTWFRTRLGVEFEKERVDDPGSVARANAFEDLHLTGVAMEGVFVFVPVKTQGIGLGLLTEYDHPVRGGSRQFYFGPIVQAVSGPWTALANLLIVQNYGSPDRARTQPPDLKRDFAYAAQLQYTLSPAWALALEAYGTIDRIGGSGHQSPEQAAFGSFDQHRIGPVVYYRFAPNGTNPSSAQGKARVRSLDKDDDNAAGKDGDDKTTNVSVGLGVLFGLTNHTPDETLKLSLEVNF